MNENFITAERLKSGEVLCALVLRFLNNRNKENMISLLSCLRDSNIWLPAKVTADGKNLQNEINRTSDNSVIFPAKQSLIVKPQIYKTKDGTDYLPIYSRKENIKSSSVAGFSVMNIPYMQCVKILEGLPTCRRMVLDPQLYNVALDENLIEITKRMPSHLQKKEK